jgi:hypothetical protein
VFFNCHPLKSLPRSTPLVESVSHTREDLVATRYIPLPGSVRDTRYTWTLLAGIMVRILCLPSSDTITFPSLFPHSSSLSMSTTSLPWVDVHRVHSIRAFDNLSVFPYSLSQVHPLTRMYSI